MVSTDLQDFVAFEGDGREALVRNGNTTVAAALLNGENCTPLTSAGRGDLLRFPIDDGWGILRTYRPGGLLKHLRNDRFLFVNRAYDELVIHDYLYRRALPVTQPLGIWWERKGPWYRGGIATREVAAQDLLRVIRDSSEDLEDVLRKVGVAIRAVHDAGVYHGDLQVLNILAGGAKVYVIDFDKARFLQELSFNQRAMNLLRLRRSFEKRDLPAECFQVVCEGYRVQSFPQWLERWYRLRGALSDRLFRERQS